MNDNNNQQARRNHIEEALTAILYDAVAAFKAWRRRHPSAPRSTACQRMSRAREGPIVLVRKIQRLQRK